MYLKKGKIKCELALAKGKKLYDKREATGREPPKPKRGRRCGGGGRQFCTFWCTLEVCET